jgi:hypothetical protein
VDTALEQLKATSSPTELARLAATVRTHASMLDEESLTRTHIDYRLAQRVSDVICELIAMSSSFDNEQRRWVAAAARYFILTDDEASDLGLDGLRDDVEAVQTVCRIVGQPALGARAAGEPQQPRT